jgi:hypothetical protein
MRARDSVKGDRGSAFYSVLAEAAHTRDPRGPLIGSLVVFRTLSHTCHPKRRNCFAKRSSFAVEGLQSAASKEFPPRPTHPACHDEKLSCRAKWDCPKDNPTQSKHPYQRPVGRNAQRRQRATSGGRSDSSPAFQRREYGEKRNQGSENKRVPILTSRKWSNPNLTSRRISIRQIGFFVKPFRASPAARVDSEPGNLGCRSMESWWRRRFNTKPRRLRTITPAARQRCMAGSR